MVHDCILDDLDTKPMRRLYQFLQFGQRTEVFVDLVEILRVVAVEPRTRFSFFQLDLVEAIVVVIPGVSQTAVTPRSFK